MKRVTVGLAVVSMLCLVSASYGAVRMFDFETGVEGWVSADSACTVSTSTIGATHGIQSMKLVDTASGWTSTAAKVSIAAHHQAFLDPANQTFEMDLTFDPADLTGAGGWVELWLVLNSGAGGWDQARPSTDDIAPTSTGGWTHGTSIETHHLTWDLTTLGWKDGLSNGTGGWFELFLITNTDSSKSYTTIYYIDNITLGSVAKDYGALKPYPADGATDVRRDVVMSWAPGVYGKTHDVYFGTNFNDVNNATRTTPLGVLVSQNQDANSYDPDGLLTLGQTYFWRIDEVNAPPDSTIYKGSVWSFTAEPVLYTVGRVTVTASSTGTGASAQNTGNGNGLTGDLHSNTSSAMWISAAAGTRPDWIQYAFDRVYELKSMWVWNYNAQFEDIIGFGVQEARVDYSTDGATWTTLGTFTVAQADGSAGRAQDAVVDFGGVAAKYVKITVVSNWGGNAQAGLSEVRFYHVIDWAREPSPASGAVGLAPDLTLGWRAGRNAASHDVYFGTAANTMTKAGTTVVNSYALSALNLGTKYFWRVDEVNAATWTGDVWNFTTAEYLPVDNMESYTDDKGSRIFDAWVDGWGTTTNGSQVGYDTSPFAEQTIVHGGKQAMPFKYSNKSPIAMSEATRTFDSAQDWTIGGADTLSLYVRGIPAYFIENSGTILMNGTGTDIWDVSDQFHFAYKTLSGNGSIIAKVESVDATDPWSKAGVMIRATTDSGSVQAMCVISGSSGASFQRRTANGGTTVGNDVAGLAAPYWVKITRNGSTFTAQTSANGTTWTDIAVSPAVTVTMPTDVLIGLAVTSHKSGAICGARFSNVSTTGTVSSVWKQGDIGVAQEAGNGLDTLYLALEDSSSHRKAVTADAYAIVSGTWQQWKIPLSSFSAAGVKLNSIKKITVGVGDSTKASSGAEGRLYIDDITYGHSAQ